MLSLLSVRKLATQTSREAQRHYKHYDKRAKNTKFKIGDWVLIYFPRDETEEIVTTVAQTLQGDISTRSRYCGI